MVTVVFLHAIIVHVSKAKAADQLGLCTAEPEQTGSTRQLPDSSPNNFIPAPRRYISRVSNNDVLIDVRVDTGAGQLPKNELAKIKGAHRMPLFSIKTKPYLKNRRVILVGDGLDYYQLEKEVVKLESLRFKFVRILQGGVLGLDDDDLLLSSNKMYRRHTVSAEKVISAAVRQPQSFHFIDLAGAIGTLDRFGFDYSSLGFSDSAAFYQTLADKMLEVDKNQSDIRFVLIAPSRQAISQLYSNVSSLAEKDSLFVDSSKTNFRDVYHAMVAANDVYSKPTCAK